MVMVLVQDRYQDPMWDGGKHKMRMAGARSVITATILAFGYLATVRASDITPSPYWKNQISFPDDAFCSFPTAGSRWIKFTILMEPYDPNVVYFQNSKKYKLHYDFAVNCLDPFAGLSSGQFYAQTIASDQPKAILGTVLYPPTHGNPPVADFNEYGIQFVTYDREQIARFFYTVQSAVVAPPGVQAIFMPTFEQQSQAQADQAWFASHGIQIGSISRWAKGNVCYSEGWALGRLRYYDSGQIYSAYLAGELLPDDILLTDGVPAEIPLVAGVMTLSPSTPNSHVAILSRTYGLPFVYLAFTKDAELARSLIGHRVILTAYTDPSGTCQTRLIDTEGLLEDELIARILELKKVRPLETSPIEEYGSYVLSTEGLLPSDARYVGGKAANFGLLRSAIPNNSPRALALTFDLWMDFLDQPLTHVRRIELPPGGHILIWADGDVDQGPLHTAFKLSAGGEVVALFDSDGSTLLDLVQFGPQVPDISYGRLADGGDQWGSMVRPTPGSANSPQRGLNRGLWINEIMADNRSTVEDPCEPGEFPDWIELFNASDQAIVLNGLYLTDDINNPTKWQIPIDVTGPTLRQEIERRLAPFRTYPPPDLRALSEQLRIVRGLFTNTMITRFEPSIQQAILAGLTDQRMGFDAGTMLRFRSSTNVEDSEQYSGAGLYDSFSGCPADDLDQDDYGPCLCDPCEGSERGVFRAIRKTFASFYNENAYLERIRRAVDESEVGMGILVNPSFPDRIELANGVATVEIAGDKGQIHLVSQLGAVSVTNPEGGAIPEEVLLQVLAGWALKSPVPADIKQYSSLVPLGGTVMTFPADYRELAGYLIAVSKAFQQISGKTSYVLDLEYKKVAAGDNTLPNGGIVIKQVRQVPQLDSSRPVIPFLISQLMTFEVFTGECYLLQDTTDIFAVHRLKSRWHLQTKNMALDPNALGQGIYQQVSIEYLDGDKVSTVTLDLTSQASHSFDGQMLVDSWLMNARTYQLMTTGIKTSVSEAENPIFTLSDLGTKGYTPYRVLTLDVRYEQQTPAWYQGLWPSCLRQVAASRVYLWPVSPADGNDILQDRSLSKNGITIRTSFYYPPLPSGYVTWVGSTAPLKRWRQTVIEGLTSEPIVLEGYYSQSFMPEHHNLIENFLFEPGLEPGISSVILDELKAKGIRYIHMVIDSDQRPPDQSMIATYGFSL